MYILALNTNSKPSPVLNLECESEVSVPHPQAPIGAGVREAALRIEAERGKRSDGDGD